MESVHTIDGINGNGTNDVYCPSIDKIVCNESVKLSKLWDQILIPMNIQYQEINRKFHDVYNNTKFSLRIKCKFAKVAILPTTLAIRKKSNFLAFHVFSDSPLHLR